MADSRDYAISARISDEAGRRLKAIAKSRRQSFGEVLDALILEVPLAAVDWVDAIEQLRMELGTRISRIEAHLALSDTPPLSVTTPIEEAPEPPPLPDIDDAITGLWRKGLGPQAIADELYRLGYRTRNGTRIQRGWVNNTIKRLRLC